MSVGRDFIPWIERICLELSLVDGIDDFVYYRLAGRGGEAALEVAEDAVGGFKVREFGVHGCTKTKP